MKPYTTTGEKNCQEDLRKNWRGKVHRSTNYHRKSIDRVYKKTYRNRGKINTREMEYPNFDTQKERNGDAYV